MKFLFLIAIASIALKASPSLPATSGEDILHYTPDSDSDVNGPLRQIVKEYTKEFVTEIDEIVSKVLTLLPNTKPYKRSRQILSTFLQNNKVYITELEYCLWNLTDFNIDFNEFLGYFANANASIHQKNVLKLLMENGLSELKPKVGTTAWRFINGDLGSTGNVNDDYC